MILVHETLRVRRSPAEVFSFLTELENFPKWQDGIVSLQALDPGPWRKGTRLKTIHSFLFWRRLEDYSEVVAFEPGRKLASRGRIGKSEYEEEFLLANDNGGAVLEYQARIKPGGIFFLIEPLAGWGVRGQMRSSFRRLKAILDDSATG